MRSNGDWDAWCRCRCRLGSVQCSIRCRCGVEDSAFLRAVRMVQLVHAFLLSVSGGPLPLECCSPTRPAQPTGDGATADLTDPSLRQVRRCSAPVATSGSRDTATCPSGQLRAAACGPSAGPRCCAERTAAARG